MKPSIWTALYAELPLRDALETLHIQGWPAFEISTEHLEQLDFEQQPDFENIATYISDTGIEVSQAHAYLRADVASFDEKKRTADIGTLERHLSLCAKLGVKVVVMHPGGRIDNPTQADREKTKALNTQSFKVLGDLAGSLGLKIGLENLTRPGAARPGELIDLIDAIDNEAFGITLDTSHANIVELDIPAAIEDIGPLLIATHISDNDRSGDQHLTPSSGSIDWPPVTEALKGIGYPGLFNLEIPGERHPVMELRALKSRHALEVAKWLGWGGE